MVERNKLCLCGSGLKYKKCYDLKLETCSLYQKDVYKALNAANDGKEKDVLTFFEEVGQEIKSVFAKDQNSREVVSIRVQAIAIFTLVDVLASYWFCYLDATEKQSVRFKSWIGEFCMTEKNKVFQKGVLGSIQVDEMYALRSSLVHFMGITGSSSKGVALAPDDSSLVALVEPYLRWTKNKGRTIELLKPVDLFDLVLEGAQIMMLEWVENKNKGKVDADIERNHVLGIARIHQKIQAEGASRVYSQKN